MHKLCIIVAIYFCEQPFAQADFRANSLTLPDYYLNIIASNDVNASGIPQDIIYGNKRYIEEAFDIMIDLVLKKAKSNSRHHYDTDIISRIGHTNTSLGLGVSRQRVRLKIKFSF